MRRAVSAGSAPAAASSSRAAVVAAGRGSREAPKTRRALSCEAGREAVDVELAHEELGDRLGEVAVAPGPAGHPEPVERVDLADLVAERREDAGQRALARRQRPGLAEDGADGPVVVDDLLPAADAVEDVERARGDPPEQVVEEERG